VRERERNDKEREGIERERIGKEKGKRASELKMKKIRARIKHTHTEEERERERMVTKNYFSVFLPGISIKMSESKETRKREKTADRFCNPTTTFQILRLTCFC